MHAPNFAIGLAVFLVAVPPAAQQVPGTERSVISGQIVDTFGCPIPDATVKLNVRLFQPPWSGPLVQETRSDSEGRFAFRPADAGSYNVEYRYERRDTTSAAGVEMVTLGSAGKWIVFQLRPPSPPDIVDLEVLVTDLDEVPVRGARITWQRRLGAETACPTGDLTSDGKGRAAEPRVPPGTYRITAEADGFAPKSVEERHGWASVPHTIRLLTIEEAEKSKKRTAVMICCGPAPPQSLGELVNAVDAIIVGRIARAELDLPDGEAAANPGVRTRYDIEPLSVIKDDARLRWSPTVSVLHGAGELEREDVIIPGCERVVMKQNETYVLFLSWDERSGSFWPAHGNELIANVTSGAVVPMPRSNVAPLIQQRKGMRAETFIRDIKAALK